MRNTFKVMTISAIAVISVAIGAGPASASNYKSMVRSVWQAVCHGAIDAQYDDAKNYWVARGAMSVPDGGGNCEMKLIRRNNSGNWPDVSDVYPNSGSGWVRTGWHWNAAETAVCVRDTSITRSWKCSDSVLNGNRV
jgi:hypothetical protein